MGFSWICRHLWSLTSTEIGDSGAHPASKTTTCNYAWIKLGFTPLRSSHDPTILVCLLWRSILQETDGIFDGAPLTMSFRVPSLWGVIKDRIRKERPVPLIIMENCCADWQQEETFPIRARACQMSGPGGCQTKCHISARWRHLACHRSKGITSEYLLNFERWVSWWYHPKPFDH